jgi:hypothetical protein
MATKLTSTRLSFRTDTNVPFFVPSIQQQEYIKTAFQDTGKIVARSTTVSADNLSETVMTEWADNIALAEFNIDPVIEQYKRDRASHNAQNHIASEVSVDWIPADEIQWGTQG